jgi:hypothetical protein
MPVGGSNVLDVLAGALGADESGSSSVEQYGVARELLRNDTREPLNAFAARRESVGEFRGHGHDVTRRRSDRCLGLVEGLCDTLNAEAKRRGDLHGIEDATAFGARSLEMGATDIPPDNDAHCASPPCYVQQASKSTARAVGQFQATHQACTSSRSSI